MKLNKVKVIGYYGHDNLGDEQYKYTITYLLRNIDKKINVDNIEYIDCDSIKSDNLNPNDFYIIGGGDVLIDYFLDKLQFFKEFRFANTKIISISSALPYNDYKIVKKMTFIDYFFLRNKNDVNYLGNIFRDRVFYLPDTCFLTKKIKYNNKKIEFNSCNNLKNILICPTLFTKDKKTNENFKIKIVDLISVLSKNYNIYIFPFGENDEILCNDIYKNIYTKKRENGVIRYISNVINKVDYINNFLSKVKIDYFIPMRYHSLLYSIIYNIPFFPIFSTIKIERFLEDIDWKHSYKINENKFELSVFLQNLSKFFKTELFFKIKKENIKIENNFFKGIELLIEKMNNYKKNTQELINIEKIKDEIHGLLSKKHKNPETMEFLTKLVSYRITNSTNSTYNWGLYRKMFLENFDWEKELSWVISDFYSKNIERIDDENNIKSLFNLDYFNQEDYSKCHRSGWEYVYKNLKKYSSVSNNVILDLYIDRTFGWDYEINSYLQLIPYKKPWYGFIHHTFNKDFSEYNVYEYFEKDNFKKSLQTCKGIFVLSKYLKKQLEYYMKLYEIKVPVNYIPHPTETNVKKFDICKFDKDKFKLLHIGGWLRNVYSFYKLSGIRNKYILQGKNMNGYIPPKFDIKMIEYEYNIDFYKNCCKNCSSGKTNKNQWIKDLEKDLKEQINSVKIISEVNNEDYDDLLSQNIVFLNLHDGSAVNTIIECIVRNTPIIINKTEFTVELLGEKYPLYYNNYTNDFNKMNNEIISLLKRKRIVKGYLYLKNMDKNKYNIEYFLQNFIKYFHNL